MYVVPDASEAQTLYATAILVCGILLGATFITIIVGVYGARTYPTARTPFGGAVALSTTDTVTQYYGLIAKRDFTDAYAMWSPTMKQGLSVTDLSNQFAATTALTADINGNPTESLVAVTVHQTDQYGSYTRHRTFNGTWRLVKVNETWLLDERNFTTVTDSGPPPSEEDQGAEYDENPGSTDAVALAKSMYETRLTKFLDAVQADSGQRLINRRWDANPKKGSPGTWVVTFTYYDPDSTPPGTESYTFDVNPGAGRAKQTSGAVALEADNAVRVEH